MDTEAPATLMNQAVAELIALGAAMAANNQEAFQRHNFRLHKMGVAREDRIQAVNIALQIKMAPHKELVDMAEAYLVGGAEPEDHGCGGGCSCGAEEGEGCGGDCSCGDEQGEGCGCGH